MYYILYSESDVDNEDEKFEVSHLLEVYTDYLIVTYHEIHYTRNCSSNVLTECENRRQKQYYFYANY